MITTNPHADYERWADNAEATAQSVEAEQAMQHADICTQVRAAILTGEPFTRVTHVSIAGKPVQVCVSEVWDDRMFDCNGDLFRLIAAALTRNVDKAQALAEGLVTMCATRHADDVIERMDVCGEVLL